MVCVLIFGLMMQVGCDFYLWFFNLLLEGVLCDFVMCGLLMGVMIDFDIFVYFGYDLLGVVVVWVEGGFVVIVVGFMFFCEGLVDVFNLICFLLVGVQFKMSMLKQDEWLIFLVIGINGNIIVKLLSECYVMLFEFEYFCMKLVEVVGVIILYCELVLVGVVVGIILDLLKGDYVFVVKCFDWKDDGVCVYVEDFCQVMQVLKECKYIVVNEEMVMNFVWCFGCGMRDYFEIV